MPILGWVAMYVSGGKDRSLPLRKVHSDEQNLNNE